MKLFIDTGPFAARVNEKDPYYEVTMKILQRIKNRELAFTRLYTSNYVIDEAVTHVLYDTGRHDLAVKVLDLIEKSRVIEVLWVIPEIEEKAREVFRKYKDQMFSLTDCTSFVLMETHGVNTAFTFDSNFKKYGFNVIPHISETIKKNRF